MPVFYEKNLHEVKLGVWKITESYEELVNQIILKKDELKKLNGYKSQQRKLQFLATRALLQYLINNDIHIKYDFNGSPFLSNNKKISISHSHNWASIIVSEINVGIDIELIDKKIQRITSRFLTKKEFNDIEINDLPSLFLYWGAKEAMVKITNNKSYIYNKDLQITPFIRENEGYFHGTIVKNEKKLNLEFKYCIFNNVVLVWSAVKI